MKLIKIILKRWVSMRLSYSMILGITIGWLVYTMLVSRYYQKLEYEIEKAPVLQNLFKEDPSMLGLFETFVTVESQTSFSSMISESRIQVLSWRLLMDMGVIELDKSVTDVGFHVSNEVINPLFQKSKTNLKETPGVVLYAQMMLALGGYDSEKNIGGLEKITARVLANSPNAYDAYISGINKRETVQNSLRNTKGTQRFLAFALPRELEEIPIIGKLVEKVWGQKASINQLIGATMSHLQVSEKFNELDKQAEGKKLPLLEEKRQVEEFARKILIEVNNNVNVSKARNWVLVYQGPMQLLMIITLFISISLLLTEFSNRILIEDKNLTEAQLCSRKQLRKTREWMFGVLPLFGFIGTILGLMQALGDAYKIPLAQGGSSTAIAISEITSQLGIAFTTTLMAFTISIILGLLKLIVHQYNVTKLKMKLAPNHG